MSTMAIGVERDQLRLIGSRPGTAGKGPRLYGAEPDPSENFGENLGTLAPRGERNVLIASLDSLMRASSNPFFPYMTGRIGEGIPAAVRGAGPVQ